MMIIDRLAHSNEWSRRHPMDKMVLAGGLLLLSLALPPVPGGPFVLAGALGAAVFGARIPATEFARLMAMPAAFIVSGALVLALSLRLDGPGPVLALSPDGLATAVEVSLRAMAASASLLLLMATTPISDVLGLLRSARVPAPLIEVVVLVYRFIMLVIGAAGTIRIAQASRLGYSSVRRSIRSTGLLAAALLPRSLERGRRLEVGLAARASDGSLRVLSSVPPPSPMFLLAAIGAHVAVAGVSILLRHQVLLP